jgi:hypothetical protein
VLQQVGSYLRYTGRAADVAATAALDPLQTFLSRPKSVPIHRRRAVFGADRVQSRKPEPVIPSKLAIPVEEPEDIGVPQLLLR